MALLVLVVAVLGQGLQVAGIEERALIPTMRSNVIHYFRQGCSVLSLVIDALAIGLLGKDVLS